MPELFTKFGGHTHAAGLTMHADGMGSFRIRFNAYAAERLSVDDFRRTVEIDALLRLDELSEESVNCVLSLAPFGMGNCAPIFAVFNAEVCGQPVVMKEKHLRLAVRQNGRTLALKAWNFADRADELRAGSKVDLALCLEEDSYSFSRGYAGWGAASRDVRPAI